MTTFSAAYVPLARLWLLSLFGQHNERAAWPIDAIHLYSWDMTCEVLLSGLALPPAWTVDFLHCHNLALALQNEGEEGDALAWGSLAFQDLGVARLRLALDRHLVRGQAVLHSDVDVLWLYGRRSLQRFVRDAPLDAALFFQAEWPAFAMDEHWALNGGLWLARPLPIVLRTVRLLLRHKPRHWDDQEGWRLALQMTGCSWALASVERWPNGYRALWHQSWAQTLRRARAIHVNWQPSLWHRQVIFCRWLRRRRRQWSWSWSCDMDRSVLQGRRLLRVNTACTLGRITEVQVTQEPWQQAAMLVVLVEQQVLANANKTLIVLPHSWQRHTWVADPWALYSWLADEPGDVAFDFDFDGSTEAETTSKMPCANIDWHSMLQRQGKGNGNRRTNHPLLQRSWPIYADWMLAVRHHFGQTQRENLAKAS